MIEASAELSASVTILTESDFDMTQELRADLCQLLNFENELTSTDVQLIVEKIVSGFIEIDPVGKFVCNNV